MFGAVGAFDWSGGILLYDLAAKKAVFLNESKEEAKKAKYSYLGKQLTPLLRSVTTWLQFCLFICSAACAGTDSIYVETISSSSWIFNIFHNRNRDSNANTVSLYSLFALMSYDVLWCYSVNASIWFHSIRTQWRALLWADKYKCLTCCECLEKKQFVNQ